MRVELNNILQFNDKVAVALSGGCDSMCLLHYLCQNSKELNLSIIALNVEHGIRGESSLKDTAFVKEYCQKNSIPLLTYSVDAPSFAKANKLSIEQAGRVLRYECFQVALKSNKCTKVATAHHRDDNVESILFNLFRGTGLKGLSGIQTTRCDGIVRPFLSVDRSELEEYAKQNSIPFVTDQTNLEDDYTRNYIRHNVVPSIKQIFPELNTSIERLSSIAKTDDEYIENVAKEKVIVAKDSASIPLPCHTAVLSRAIIIALKSLGVKKDWEKTHIDQTIALTGLENGSKLSLLNGITVIKEYDKITFYKESKKSDEKTPFTLGETTFLGKTLVITKEEKDKIDLKSGLYLDLDKVPSSAVIRTRADGDIFTKFGGGSKSLNDYFTDKKVPQRKRDEQVLIADGNQVLAIFGLAISNKVRIDDDTENVVSITVKN